jgi:hypothetical protein
LWTVKAHLAFMNLPVEVKGEETEVGW